MATTTAGATTVKIYRRTTYVYGASTRMGHEYSFRPLASTVTARDGCIHRSETGGEEPYIEVEVPDGSRCGDELLATPGGRWLDASDVYNLCKRVGDRFVLRAK